jgi:predicted negative regulator of RcsB-dependent stress response
MNSKRASAKSRQYWRQVGKYLIFAVVLFVVIWMLFEAVKQQTRQQPGRVVWRQ